MKRTWPELDAITGGLSSPSKMPCHGYSIPATRCKLGAILRETPGSTCGKCYALKGRYVFPMVQSALEKRYQALTDRRWVAAMRVSIRKAGQGFFRWHDSGDLQGLWHLGNICKVAAGTPEVKHWLPTRERRTVRRYIEAGGRIPPNLTIRVSATMIGERTNGTLPTSTVAAGLGVPCKAKDRGGHCGDCRACWDPKVENVDYPLH